MRCNVTFLEPFVRIRKFGFVFGDGVTRVLSTRWCLELGDQKGPTPRDQGEEVERSIRNEENTIGLADTPLRPIGCDGIGFVYNKSVLAFLLVQPVFKFDVVTDIRMCALQFPFSLEGSPSDGY